MRVARTESWTTLFNTPVLYSESVPDMNDWIWDVFAMTPPMSTYTLALAIMDFASVPSAGNMTVWAQEPYEQKGFADYAAKIGPQCVEAT